MHDPATRADPAAQAALEDARLVLEVVRGWELKPEEEQIAILIDAALEKSRSDDDRRHRLRQVWLPLLSKRRRATRNAARDQAIVDLITYIQHRHEIDPTRNRATRDRLSGCAIVSRALREFGFDLKEAGAEEVWRLMGKQANPGWIPFRLSQARRQA
jgi:hypothetical protein